MDTRSPSPPDADDWTARLQAEQHRCEQAEAALAAAEARIARLTQQLAAADTRTQRFRTQLAALTQNLRIGLLLVDNEGHIQLVNSYFRELFGLEPEVTIAEVYPPVLPDTVSIESAFQDPAAFSARVGFLHQAGKTVLNEEFWLANGRVVELDYLVLDETQAGRLICYRDVTERHQRDAQIRTLSLIPEQNPNPILRLSPAGEVLYANPSAGPLLQTLHEDVDGQLQQVLLELVDTALHTAEQQQQELALDGRYYLFTAAAVPGQNYATLYFTNITGWRKAEQQLAEQKTFYETILEKIPLAVAVFDPEFRYLFVNPAVEPDPVVRRWMLGKTSEEAGHLRQRPSATIALRERYFRQALHTQTEVTWEEEFHDGQSMRHLLRHLRPVPGPTGEVHLLIGSGIDITERKQAEENAAQQQEFYESILNLLPVDVAVFDEQHRFLFVNPSSVSSPELRRLMIGMSSAEYLAFRQRPAELAAVRDQHFAQAVRTRADATWEETLPTPQGFKRILRTLRAVFRPDGELQMVVGSGIDITARYAAEEGQRQVEALLREQQAFVRMVVDNLPSVVYVKNANNEVYFRNAAFDALAARSQHWPPEQEKDQAVREELWQIRVWCQQVLATRKPLSTELPLTLAGGEICHLHVELRPLVQANGEVSVLIVSTNITALKEARHAAERREKQYHDLVRYSQALICTHDLDGNLLTVNPAIERLLGKSAAQLVGHNLREALAPEHHAALLAYLTDTRPHRSEPSLMSIMTASGERRYLRHYTYRVQEAGQAPYVVASGYDVTQGVRAERALQQAKHEADANARAKEAFLARMSHEIRTPLNGVLGMATLLEKTELTGIQQEYLATMQRAGRHLLALVNDVLDMAKITTQHLELDHTEFDLAVVLQGAWETVAALAAEKNLQLQVEPLPLATPRVLGDAYRLHQVLLNLLSNAIKFTQRGGVRLGAEVLADAPDALRLRFWVQDTGIGIAPEQQARIFEAFTQASTSPSHQVGGTGLGLAISEQLVQQMGGQLQLCSEAGRGTTFSFILALPPAPEIALVATSPAVSYEGLRGLRVLLAEDNLVNQWITTVLLEQRGVLVEAVSNGTDALARLQTTAYDVGVLDIQMPGLSGVEVATAIRRYPDAGRAGVPLIALTANAFDADRAGYLAAGMNACLTKPFEEADLYHLLLLLTGALPPAQEGNVPVK